MLGEFDFNPGPWRSRARIPEDATPLSAKISLSATGVQISFSNGRSAWMLREPNVAESTFLAAVVDWVRRRGVRSLEIELEENST